MGDQADILRKWLSLLAKGQLNHSYSFWTMPILLFSLVYLILKHPLYIISFFFAGKFCQVCETCQNQCTQLRPCVECLAFNSSKLLINPNSTSEEKRDIQANCREHCPLEYMELIPSRYFFNNKQIQLILLGIWILLMYDYFI